MKNIVLLLLIIFVSFKVKAQDGIGKNIFDDTRIHVVRLNTHEDISYDDFHSRLHSIYAPEQKDNTIDNTYFPCSVTIDGTTLDTIGVRYKGHSTFDGLSANGKFSFKIDFNEFVDGQEFEGLKKINLDNNRWDVTCMRNKLAMESMKRMGIASPRTSYAKVYANGSYRGIYLLVEQIDRTFLKNRFPSDTVGYLYKMMDWTGGPLLFPSSEVLENSVRPKTKRNKDWKKPLIDLWEFTNDTPDSLFYHKVSQVLDYEGFIKQMALQTFMGDRDHYCVSGSNHYLYLDPNTNKFIMIPWDYDLSWNKDWFGGDYLNVKNPVNWDDCRNHTNSVYASKMFNIPEIAQKYQGAICEVLRYGFDSLWVEERINTLAKLIGDEVEEDPVHFAQITNFKYQLDNSYTYTDAYSSGNYRIYYGLRTLIRRRYQEVRNALNEAGCTCHESKSPGNNK